MLKVTKAELDKHDALNPIINTHIQRVINAIPFPTVDERMKAVIALSQVTAFASQFRRNIMLWDGTSVPINAISFVITGSGGGKDSSVKAARKCFKPGYELIEAARKKQVIQQAIKLAADAGDEPSNEFEIYKAYMSPVPPIDIMPTTGPGLIQHINDISDLELSTGFMYAGEVSDELAHNPDMMENIKILSEIYDTGDKEMKYTKGIEYRSKAINGQPVSALCVGSPGYILYDKATREKFVIAFMSKLARRSWFCYTPERIPEPIFDTLDEMLEHAEQVEIKGLQAREAMSEHVKAITAFGLKTAGSHISVPKAVFRLFETYKRYNSDTADSMANQDSTSALIRRHLQWKALKLAGAFTVFDKSDELLPHHYIDAIRFCELLSKDMELFEYDLNKSDHERFADYIHTQVQADGKAIISVHEIKKQNFIQTTSKPKLQELLTLCATYDTTGVYSLINDASAIQYEPIIKTDVLGISFKPIDTRQLDLALASKDPEQVKAAKQAIAKTTAYGLEVGDTTFSDLSGLLAKDYSFSPFKFTNGVRGKDNILGGTKWLVFDVDNSVISATEAHFMLSDLNHHIALGSDPDNDFKFHILLELDSVVELNHTAWKYFYTAIADSLGLSVDLLPQSQIFFSYAGRPVLSITDGEPLEVRTFVTSAKEKLANSGIEKKLTPIQQKTQLADPLETFAFCFECPLDGPGSRSMITMAYKAKFLGADEAQVIDLLNQVQEYWPSPLSETRFEGILNQVSRMF